MVKPIVVTVVILFSAGAALAQDIAAGEASFRKCTPCHNIGPEAENKVGPHLNGLDGHKAGTVPEFGYSEANKSSGITWNEDVFKEYIKDPRAKVRVPRWCLPVSRAKRSSTICGPMYRSSMSTAIPGKNDDRHRRPV